MYLFIHAAQVDNAFILLVSAKGSSIGEKKMRFSETHEKNILPFLDALLRSKKIKPARLKGICVLSGPGRFSFLRTSIATANTFGFCLNIPVVGISEDMFFSKKEFIDLGVKKIHKKKGFKQIMPLYGKEPNITKPVDQLTS